MPHQEILPLLAAMPLLWFAAWTDLRELRIPDWLSVAGLAMFVLTAPFIGTEAALWRLCAGALSFAICFGLFAARIVGGGDAKFFPVLMLFIPAGTYVSFLTVFVYSLAACMLVFVPIRRFAPPVGHWKSMRADGRFPMGLSFATATTVFLFQSL